ncbi:MAG: gamma-butyrobetaine hydroxylase-like domain-containing protein [Chloroflexota bacterium]
MTTVAQGSLPPTASPVGIHADRGAGTLSIDWADDHHTQYDLDALRWLCPCAYCRGEAGLPGWLDSAPTLTREQTRLVDVQLVGNYALAPSWGDGHHTGYYTFALLRENCPCADCTARRARAPHEGHR